MEGRLYMYRVLTATGHGRELQAPPLVFGVSILSKCRKLSISVNRNFVVSSKTKILTEENF